MYVVLTIFLYIYHYWYQGLYLVPGTMDMISTVYIPVDRIRFAWKGHSDQLPPLFYYTFDQPRGSSGSFKSSCCLSSIALLLKWKPDSEHRLLQTNGTKRNNQIWDSHYGTSLRYTHATTFMNCYCF